MATIKRHWPVAAILVIFFGLGVAYSVITPLFESPDEVWHYEYVRWLVEGRGLPTPEQVGTAPWHQEGSQPPLYYLAAAVLTAGIPTDNAGAVIRYNPHAAVGQANAVGNKNIMVHGRADAWPWQGVVLAAHLARLFSLLLGAVTVLAAYGIALCLFPGRRVVGVLAASLVAFNPQFLFITSSITNIALVTAACSAGVWLGVRMLDKYARAPEDGGAGRSAAARGVLAGPTLVELLLLGALVGVAALAQLSGIALVGLAGLALLAVAWRQRTPFRNLVVWIVIVAAAALLVAGWWYIRNLALYGDPLGLQAMFDVLPKRAARPTVGELVARAQGVWRSMWAVFGWFNVVAPEWLYAVYAVISLAGLAGLFVAWPARHIAGARGRRVRLGEARRQFRLQFLLLLVWIAVMLLLVFAWTQMRYPQGRLLFPALAAISVLLAFGITNWLPRSFHRVLGVVLPVGLAALAVIAPLVWIAPAYAAPALLAPGAGVPNQSSVDFGGQVRLVGYEIGEEQVQPGGALPLTLYWQAAAGPAADYSVFIHLVDANGVLQAQQDSYPGAGSLPTSEWLAGPVIPDRHVVQLPRTAIKSPRLSVLVGIYDYSTGKRLSVEGRDLWEIGEVGVAPRTSAEGIPNPVDIKFDNQIALKGFDFDRDTMRPGETIKLNLWWEALAAPKADYVVFAHLVYPPDAVWVGFDQMPQGGAAPTSHWQPGQQASDSAELKLPAEAPAGVYFIEIGLYDPATMQRLKVDGSDAGIVLGYVKVG